MLSEMEQLADAVPVRARVGISLLVLECIGRRVHASVRPTVLALVELGWKWQGGDVSVLEAIYEKFGFLVEDWLALQGADARVGKAAVQVAYCLVWEAYSEAYDRGLVDANHLPAEVAEGDSGLWHELAEALNSDMLNGELSLEFLAAAGRRLAGNPGDRDARFSREQPAQARALPYRPARKNVHENCTSRSLRETLSTSFVCVDESIDR